MISGKITSFKIPQVKAGEYLDVTLEYNAFNPNGSFFNPWKIFVVAKDSIGNKEMVKDADVRSDKFTDSGTWRLWKMPNSTITVEVRLFGHDEIVPWDWRWW